MVDLLQERARDKASISDKEMVALELASPESHRPYVYYAAEPLCRRPHCHDLCMQWSPGTHNLAGRLICCSHDNVTCKTEACLFGCEGYGVRPVYWLTAERGATCTAA